MPRSSVEKPCSRRLHREWLACQIMRQIKTILIAALTAGTLLLPHSADAQGRCMSRAEQRDAVRSGQAVRPGQLRRSVNGKVLTLRLCQGGRGLVWRMRVLGRDGRVVDRVIDARSGRPIR